MKPQERDLEICKTCSAQLSCMGCQQWSTWISCPNCGSVTEFHGLPARNPETGKLMCQEMVVAGYCACLKKQVHIYGKDSIKIRKEEENAKKLGSM